MTLTYTVGKGIYVNLTNRCSNACDFCIRQYGPTVYGSDNLWLEREPTAAEVIADLDKYDLSQYEELVFCGYGEPTERIDVLVEVARAVKARRDIPIRINTNGHGNLINGRDITSEVEGLVDIMSISLNTANAEDYVRICHPEFGAAAYEGLLEFARLSVPRVKRVVLSVVETTLPDSDIDKCRAMAEAMGAELRVRPFE
ncbi:MAG: TatD family nuclease-associated radical SAM protein [Clostridia bacterium]|nr:TatD family nuclease-associated radical SAM protein [Clostridia bacterium]